jgi:hypothetical protein
MLGQFADFEKMFRRYQTIWVATTLMAGGVDE